MAVNRLAAVPDLSALSSLDELWLNGNQIASWEGLGRPALLPALRTLYLDGNPLRSSDGFVDDLRRSFPALEELDSAIFSSR